MYNFLYVNPILLLKETPVITVTMTLSYLFSTPSGQCCIIAHGPNHRQTTGRKMRKTNGNTVTWTFHKNVTLSFC